MSTSVPEHSRTQSPAHHLPAAWSISSSPPLTETSSTGMLIWPLSSLLLRSLLSLLFPCPAREGCGFHVLPREGSGSQSNPVRSPVSMSSPEKAPIPEFSPESLEAHKCPLLPPPPLSSGRPSARPQYPLTSLPASKPLPVDLLAPPWVLAPSFPQSTSSTGLPRPSSSALVWCRPSCASSLHSSGSFIPLAPPQSSVTPALPWPFGSTPPCHMLQVPPVSFLAPPFI